MKKSLVTFITSIFITTISPAHAHAASYTLTISPVASDKSYTGSCTPKYKSCNVTVIVPLVENVGLLSFNTVEFRATISDQHTTITFFWGNVPLSPAESGMFRFEKSTDDLI